MKEKQSQKEKINQLKAEKEQVKEELCCKTINL